MRTKVISRPLGNIEVEKSMEGIWKSEDRNYISKKPVSILPPNANLQGREKICRAKTVRSSRTRRGDVDRKVMVQSPGVRLSRKVPAQVPRAWKMLRKESCSDGKFISGGYSEISARRGDHRKRTKGQVGLYGFYIFSFFFPFLLHTSLLVFLPT